MKLSLLLLTLLQLHEIIQLKDQTLIETACKNTPNYDLCVSTLHDSPSSAAADVAGLGLILVDVVKSKTEAALSAVEEMRRRHPEMRGALDQCWISYKAVLVADVPEAVAALTKGVPKFAEFGMADAAWEAEICEGSFEMTAATPLSGVNKEIHDLAQVAVGIIRILL
ncbi:hypothetical protein C2S51_019114 [Perilla frutescens var. frutescens]|nr:hypothetical protein C2S51_019114 [Perilla frutescens var. frutescens]